MLSTRTAICCLVISLYLVAASKCNGEGYAPAPNCARNECPAYTVLHSQKEFEIRNYTVARWVHGPTIPSDSYEAAASKGFQMLSEYYKGKNRENMRIDMTSPVLVRIENSTYTVYFNLPQEYQTFAPRPLTDEIGLDIMPLWPHKYAAVRRFDGLISDAIIPIQLNALKESLESSPNYRRAATGGVSMVAAYNSPMELTNRVNEVFIWFD